MANQFKTLEIRGNNIILTNPACYWNSTERNEEIMQATEICYKSDMETLNKAHHLDKQRLFAHFIRKYPHHKILGY